jgi:hypothetical protein
VSSAVTPPESCETAVHSVQKPWPCGAQCCDGDGAETALVDCAYVKHAIVPRVEKLGFERDHVSPGDGGELVWLTRSLP